MKILEIRKPYEVEPASIASSFDENIGNKNSSVVNHVMRRGDLAGSSDVVDANLG